MTICGEKIRTTRLDDADSATEALCVNGGQSLQLVRQLTAAALNCIISNGRPDCLGLSTEGVFKACNDACAQGNVSAYDLCIDGLDCVNNGGSFDMATRSCDEVEEDSCHDRPLTNPRLGLNLEPSDAAGGSSECNSAKSNSCTVVRPGETRCTLGNKAPGTESCP
jgi:hypothetical protein